MLSMTWVPKLFSLPKVKGATTEPHGHYSAYANTDMTTTQKNNITILCSSNFAKNITRILTFSVCKQQHWVNMQLSTNTGLCTSVRIKGSMRPYFAAMWKEFKTFLHITFTSETHLLRWVGGLYGTEQDHAGFYFGDVQLEIILHTKLQSIQSVFFMCAVLLVCRRFRYQFAHAAVWPVLV